LSEVKKAPKHNVVRNGGNDASKASERATVLSGNRLLLVEDETLVGMMMKDTLTELGFEVVGPYSTMKAATAAVNTEKFDGAILDVNLAGELIYSLAEIVERRGLPFIFVTGYGSDGIDSRFAKVPILQKPIERQKLQSMFQVVPVGGRPPLTEQASISLS
jgi:CheY-like chemotaxis protein